MRRGRPAPWPGAIGAVAGQATLAGGSFVLQLVAARSLGPAQFGVFALLFGAIVMATAISSGLVGDSLTVLDRHDPAIGSALVRTAAVVVAGAAGVGATAATALGAGARTAAAFAAATAAFMLADLARRLLMATLRFWHLVAVDLLGFGAAMGVLALGAAVGRIGLVDVLLALAVGQAVACGVAVVALPARERVLPVRRSGGLGAVWAFGGWRAVQQFVRPTTLNAARWLVLVSAGAVAVGELEAARLLVAPAMLLVQGVGAYLFASYAADRTVPLGRLLRRADRAGATLLAGAGALTLVAALLCPLLAGTLAPGYEIAVPAVVGWGAYIASCAAVLPYGSLAAVRGRPAAVLGVRAADALVSLGALAAVVVLLGGPPTAAPWLLAAGSCLGGLACRRLLLVPMLDRPAVAAGPAARRGVHEGAPA